MTGRIFISAWAFVYKFFGNTSSSPGFFHRETLSLLQRLARPTTGLLLAAVLLQVPSALATDCTQKLPANSPPARSSPAIPYDAASGHDVPISGAASNY